ncbi:MAG: hypothetical protein K0Q59_1123 [Paenibacillus sp.]|nr:hypothetical protein [Paenibacillus sp.]
MNMNPSKPSRFGRLLLLTLLCVALLLAEAAARPVFAHLTGAFADYLAAVYDTRTTDKLRQEMSGLEDELKLLAPKVDDLERQFNQQRRDAVQQLLFYADSGLDMWLTIAMQQKSGQVVDLLGSQWVIKLQLQSLLNELEALYGDYVQLTTAQASLARYHQLLVAIDRNLAMRQPYLQSVQQYALEEQANFLDIDWASEVEAPLIAALTHDRQLIAERWREWAVRTPPSAAADAVYQFGEAWLLANGKLTYYMRADHIYTVFERPGAHVILIGQIAANALDEAELTFESGFYNGFAMPDVLFDELQGFAIPYSALRSLPGASNRSYIEQQSGKLNLVY